MKTAREKIEWALKFVDMDLGLLREGDRLNLVADMALFLEEGNAHLAGQIQDGDVLLKAEAKSGGKVQQRRKK